MTTRRSGFLKEAIDGGDVASAIREYEDRYGGTGPEVQDRRKREYKNFAKLYFDLVTDFYEFGWNTSFHFAPRKRNESFAASLAHHEHYLARKLGLSEGMVALDLGCGIGGPLREMVRFSGARIVGVSISRYQIERARSQTEEAGLGHLAEYLECDFMKMDFPEESFDAVFSIETTCCAPHKVGIFSEAFRLLKPGGRFGAYEYCLTDRFDPEDPEHLRLSADLEVGGSLPEIASTHEVDRAITESGFELLDSRDLAEDDRFGVPWYEPLAKSSLSPGNFRSSPIGRLVTHSLVGALEKLGVVPRGTQRVSRLLNVAAAAFARSGQLGIFTPMYFVLGRKPG